MGIKSDHELLIEIHSAMCGINGEGGCLKRQERLSKDFYNFRMVVIIALVLLAGGSGFTLAEIVKVIR